MKQILNIILRLIGTKISTDNFGNQYYVINLKSEHRYVIYKGGVEASKVPPVWNLWLRRAITSNQLLEYQDMLSGRYNSIPWIKDYLPNLTGTSNYDYQDLNTKTERNQYQAWKPSSD